MVSKVSVNEPDLSGNEKKYLNECIDTGWISSEGPFVKRFEEGMASLTQRKHAIAVCNGSIALDVALLALDIAPGSEIIMPSFTIISCASAIVRANCVPVLVDSDPLTWNVNIEQIESKITSKTAAIMAVHIYGLPVDMTAMTALAKKYDLKIIEDAAEAIGQTCDGKPCGSFGDVSCFSFYPNKHITTGEGGMVLCNSDTLAERLRSLRNLSFSSERRFLHHELGYNYRMSNIQAALGLAQLEKIDRTIQKKRHIGQKYQDLLKSIHGLQLPIEAVSYAENLYWVFGVVLNENVAIDAQKFEKRLNAKGIGTRPFFWPMHEQPVFIKQGFFRGEYYPVAEKLARRGFYIPSGLTLTDQQIENVVHQIICILEEVE